MDEACSRCSFTLDPSSMGRLPVYFRTLNVHAVPDKELPDLIRDHLGEVKRRRNDLMLPTHPPGR